MFAPTRWLLEIYPIDEILARELKIDLEEDPLREAPIGSPAYEVIATAPAAPSCSGGRSSRRSSSGRSSIGFPTTSTCG